MEAPVRHILQKHTFWLSSERVLYWEDERTLIVSDLHFGKTGHFRKAGIPVPQSVFKEDLQRLVVQLQHYSPRQLLVVGDLFHSVANKELDLFCRWRNDLPGLSVVLVKGNHDILKDSWYCNAGITLAVDNLLIDGVCFTHDKSCNSTFSASPDKELTYTISGHIHPGIKVKGIGRQSLSLPCFYFGEEYAVLPAFSRFTGTAMIEPKAGDSVFAIVNNSIVKIR